MGFCLFSYSKEKQALSCWPPAQIHGQRPGLCGLELSPPPLLPSKLHDANSADVRGRCSDVQPRSPFRNEGLIFLAVQWAAGQQRLALSSLGELPWLKGATLPRAALIQ